MTEKLIKIATDFSRTPGGRYRSDGPASGEEFREDILIPALSHGDTVTIDLDGARGYPSSFLEEAFGGLVRRLKLKGDDFARRVKFKASPAFEIYILDINSYVQQTVHG